MTKLLTADQIANFPVAHFSTSAIRSYLTDRQGFFRRYVRLEFDSKSGAAMIEGNLFHAVLEDFWEAKKEGYDEDLFELLEKAIQQFDVDQKWEEVDFGANGSKEKSIDTVKQALKFYQAELPQFEGIYGTELKFFSDFEDLEGNPMPVPLKGFCDLIVKEGEDFVIEDHKLVSKITKQDEVCPAYEIQAAAYWFLTRKEFGINPKRMVFRQTKKTKNTFEGTIEELEALFEEKGLEFWEVSEKSQLIKIAKANGLSTVTIPAVTKELSDLPVAEIKQILTDKGIEFKKSGKKDELVAAASDAGIINVDIPAKEVAIEDLKTKEIKVVLMEAQVPFETVSKKAQMVEFGVKEGAIVLDPQVVPYVVEYTSHVLERFLELYRRIVKELSGQPLIDEATGVVQFLPNPYAQFGWEESWADFCFEVAEGKCWTLSELLPKKANRFADEKIEALDL